MAIQGTTRKSELVLPLGDELATGKRIGLPIQAFHRGGYFTGQSGQGKSSTICRLLVEVTRGGSPAIIIDDAGETFQQLERFAAFYGYGLHRTMLDARIPQPRRIELLRQMVLRRFTFGFVGHGRTNHVGIDLLKRRRLLDRRESVEEVVIATLKPFEARFTDINVRTRFVRVFRPLMTALVAAERPITEAAALLLDPRYWPFLLRELERSGSMNDDVTRAFVAPRLESLRQVLDLRKDKEGNERQPYPQRFWDRIESTWNAIEPFTPGGVIAGFFDTDSFSPEEVVFHNGVFAVTSDLSDELTRNQTMATIYTFFERLMKYRVPALGLAPYRLYLVLDEVRWFYEGLTRFFSACRNNRVSAFVLNQRDEQWEQLGMPAIAKTLPGLLRLRIQYRAQTSYVADEMAIRGPKYDPFGMQKREVTASRSRGRSRGSVESNSSTDSESDTTGGSYTRGGGRGTNTGSSSGWTSAPDGEFLSYTGGTSLGDATHDTWSDGQSYGHGTTRAYGSASGRSRTVTESETSAEHILNASVADQHFLRMQEMRMLPEHCALVSHEDVSKLVRMLPFQGFPEVYEGKNIYKDFCEAAELEHVNRRSARPPYDPTIQLISAPENVKDPIQPSKPAPEAVLKKRPSKPRRPQR